MEDIVGRQFERQPRIDAPPEELRVRTTHALRHAGCARGIENCECIARTTIRSGNRIASRFHWYGRRQGSPRLFAALPDQPDCLYRQQGEIHQVEHRKQIGLDDEQPGAGIFENVLKLGATHRRIDRGDDSAEPPASQHQLDEFNAIAAHDRDSVTTLDARLRQRPGGPGRIVECGRIGEAQFANFDQILRWEPCRLPVQQHREDALEGVKLISNTIHRSQKTL
jgi:hypothetical protein